VCGTKYLLIWHKAERHQPRIFIFPGRGTRSWAVDPWAWPAVVAAGNRAHAERYHRTAPLVAAQWWAHPTGKWERKSVVVLGTCQDNLYSL